MKRRFFKLAHARHGLTIFSSIGLVIGLAAQADPLSSNNGMYPKPDDGTVVGETYNGVYNVANLAYPETLPEQEWVWDGGPLNQSNAEAYMVALKKHIEPTMRTLVEDVQNWDAVEANWYNIVWRGAGDSPEKGREVIMNTNTGQIVPSDTWSKPFQPTTKYVQNYGVIYFNPRAAFMLGEVWADVYKPNISKQQYPEGSIVVKVEAATIQPNQWPWDDPAAGVDSVLEGAAEWQVFRPTTEDQKRRQSDPNHKLINKVQTVYPFQLAIRVKDTVASPDTGWVFMGFVFDARIKGDSPWDKFVPAGMMWGNDPDFARDPNGLPPGETLQETWVNVDKAPPFVMDTLGWGGRMAAPMDVAVRHEVVLPDGTWYRKAERFRASSCLSCHGAAQYPFAANLYPSPNVVFPPDGTTFPMYQPGSAKWAEWYENRKGHEPQSPNGSVALDYDLTSTIAFGIWAGSTGQDAFALEVLHGH